MTAFTVETLPAISHNSIPVITTELLAQLYGTTAHSITKNHRNNVDRFVPEKHFYKIVGQELNTLRITFGDLQIHPKTRALILWTERGAARHAKMLETDQAWDVFEKLEDCYFNQRESRPEKTTTLERTPLRDAVNLLVGKTGMIYSDAYSLIHQRFNVERIEDLTQTQMLQAIEYIHCLIIDNRPVSSPLFSGRVLLTFKEGRMDRAEVARDDEQLISATTMVELLQKRGFVIMTKRRVDNTDCWYFGLIWWRRDAPRHRSHLVTVSAHQIVADNSGRAPVLLPHVRAVSLFSGHS